MLRIAELNGLDQNSPTIIEDIQSYILGAAIYNMKHKPYPDNVDKAIYFLEHLYEGICQHFAMAATVMYRAHGIPARYTVGYAVDAKAGEWVEVGIDRAHAWVEIYMDGFGWVPIEVTPGGTNGDGPGNGTAKGPGPIGPGPGDEDNKPTITIFTGNASKKYDGTPLYKDFYYIDGKLETGDVLDVDVFASITQVGEVTNDFNAVIYNSNGEDVTSKYNIRKIPGLLVVVPNNDKPIIEIKVIDIKKTYTGEVIKPNNDDYYVVSNNLEAGSYIDIIIQGEITDVGIERTYILKSNLRIYNKDNIDITNNYNVVAYLGSLEVTKRQITIMTESNEKIYDGIALTSNTYYISIGSLVENHVIEVEMTSSIIEVRNPRKYFKGNIN